MFIIFLQRKINCAVKSSKMYLSKKNCDGDHFFNVSFQERLFSSGHYPMEASVGFQEERHKHDFTLIS